MRTNFSKYGVRIPIDSGKPLNIPKVSAGLKISTDVAMDDNKYPIRFAYVNDTLHTTEFPGSPKIDVERLVWLALKPISEEIKRAKGIESPPCLITESVEGAHGRIMHFTNLKDYWDDQTMQRVTSAPNLSEEDQIILNSFFERINKDISNLPGHIYAFESVGECIKPLLQFMTIHELDYKPLEEAFSQIKNHDKLKTKQDMKYLDSIFVDVLIKSCKNVSEYIQQNNISLKTVELEEER